MMTREEVENRILDRLEGECSPAEAEAFDNALVHYPDLRDEYESLRATREHLETHSESTKQVYQLSPEALDQVIKRAKIEARDASISTAPLEAPRPSWLRQIFSGEWLSQGMGGWAPAFGILLVAGVGWMQIQDGAVFVEQERAQDSGQAVSSVAIPRLETREEKARPHNAVREVSPPNDGEFGEPVPRMDRLAVGGTPDEVRDSSRGETASPLADVALPDEASVSRSKRRAESAAQPPVTRKIAKDAAAPPQSPLPQRQRGKKGISKAKRKSTGLGPENPQSIASPPPSAKANSAFSSPPRSQSSGLSSGLAPELRGKKRKAPVSADLGGLDSAMKSPGKATEIVSFKAKPADKIGAGSGFIPPAASGPVASEQPYAPPTIEAEPDVQQAIVVEALPEAEESPITGLLDQAIQTLKDGQVNQGVDQLERLIAQRNALSSKALLRGVQTLLQLGLQRRAGLLLGYAEQTGNGDPSWPLALEKARKWVEQKTQ